MPENTPPRPQAGPRPPAPRGPRPPAQSAPQASALGTIDPVKLLLKYMWVLAGAVILGGVCGVGAHFVILNTRPTFTSEVIFEAVAPEGDATQAIGVNPGNEDEMARFIATQVAFMKSEAVLEAVVRDPRLAAEAPDWYKSYVDNGAFQPFDALDGLEKIIGVRNTPGTTLIVLNAKWHDATDTTAIVKLVKETYRNILQTTSRGDVAERQDVINRNINDIDQRIADLNARRERLIRDENIDTINAQSSDANQRLNLINTELIGVTQAIEGAQSQLNTFESMIGSTAGITYTDTQRATVDQNPIAGNFRQQIKTLEAELLSLKQVGIQPRHRSYKAVQAQLDATNQKLNDLREELLRQQFDAELDGLRSALRGLRAQESDLLERYTTAVTEASDLTRLLGQITDIDQTINRLIESRGARQDELSALVAASSLSSASRMIVRQPERIPNRVSFPKLPVMGGAGVVIVAGLVGGLILLREVLDQRIKGPADVKMIPRTNLLGMIPLASEDPSNPKNFEALFADSPKGVLAESFRQVRTQLLSRMSERGLKSVVFVGGMPNSGTTSLIANVAAACVLSERKVLIIDANLRRPRQHAIFGLPEGPGLSDVLAGTHEFADVIARGEEGKPDVLTAGSKQARVYERLGTTAIDQLLATASEEYDLILLDVSPSIVSGDGLSLANHVDACVLVVRAFGEKRGMVARLNNELHDANGHMLGILVNGVRSSAGGYLGRNLRTSHAYEAATPVGAGAGSDKQA